MYAYTFALFSNSNVLVLLEVLGLLIGFVLLLLLFLEMSSIKNVKYGTVYQLLNLLHSIVTNNAKEHKFIIQHIQSTLLQMNRKSQIQDTSLCSTYDKD